MRASICLFLVVASAFFAVPFTPQSSPLISSSLPSFNPYRFDPNGTQYAFNSTVADLDVYTNLTATVGGNCSFGTNCYLAWFSALNDTVSGQPILGTGFQFNLTGTGVRETVNYTLTVPRGAGTSTYLRFQWNGTVGAGTGARYLVSNSTSPTNTDPSRIKTSVFRPSTSNQTGTFFGSNSPGPNGGPPLPCGRNDECFDITDLIGYNITLTFLFNSTTTATGHLRISANNIEVVSLGASSPASSHSMSIDTNPAQIDHDARLVVSYNSTVSYPKPHTTQTLVHKWSTTLLSFYSPATYTSENYTLGTAQINSATFLSNHSFAQGLCTAQGLVHCTSVQFFSVNVTDLAPSTAQNTLVTAQSLNALASVTTGIGSVDANYWTPGENMTVRARNAPGVNLTGTQVGLLEPVPSSGPAPLNVTLSVAAPIGSANYTIAIPTTVTPLGSWTLALTFSNGFDFGFKTHDITIDELQVNSGSSITGAVGSGSSIGVSGRISYLSNPAFQPVNYNVGVFAVGSGTALLRNTGQNNGGLYISNITSVAGVGSPHQPIIMYITFRNNGTLTYDANITIDHEWFPGATHGVNVTIPLRQSSIDNGNDFQFTPLTYSLQALVTASGMELTLQSLATKAKVVVSMTPGIPESAVPSTRQHFGQFKITLHAKDKTNHILESPLPSVESPPYAYVLYTPLLPIQLLAYNTTTATSSNGGFSASLDSTHLLGVKSVRVLVLARDVNGVVLGDSDKDPTVFSDSTSLTPTVDAPSSVAVQESVRATLHLKSNATTLVTRITVNLNITGPAAVPLQTKTVTIQPGATSDFAFSFTAPSKTGVYTMTFSTPQYGPAGAPLLSKTIVVSVVSTTIQVILLPAIGIVIAAIIVIVYTRRKQPTEDSKTEKTKTRSTGTTKRADSAPRNP